MIFLERWWYNPKYGSSGTTDSDKWVGNERKLDIFHVFHVGKAS